MAEVEWKIRLLEERRLKSSNSSELEVLAMGILKSPQDMSKIVQRMVVEKQVLKYQEKKRNTPGSVEIAVMIVAVTL